MVLIILVHLSALLARSSTGVKSLIPWHQLVLIYTI